MFKKPLGNLKASGAFRGSDRRKFQQRVVTAFGVSQDESDQLVPDGLQSIEFSTYLNQQGVAYLGPEGDPLWFTIGRGSEELIPTVYTLWKKRDLVPCVSTPPSITRVLIGGGNLMIHRAIQRPTQSIAKDQLVSVCQYDPKEGQPTLSAPLIIGRMAISSDQMTACEKGEAVIVLHAWKDHLWDMGSKLDVPEPTMIAEATHEGEDSGPQEQKHTSHTTTSASHTPQEVTDILHNSLLQSISTILSSLPVTGFPIPSTQFYTSYILSCRPHYIPESSGESLFVNAQEPAKAFTANGFTVKDAEEKAKREQMEKASAAKFELGVRLLWKPHMETTHLFECIGGDPNTLYTMQEIKTLLDSYISSRNLVKTNDQAHINLDNLLRECIYAKQQSKQAKAGEDVSLLNGKLIKREELVKKVIAKMQDWYEIMRNGKRSQKEGTLKPIQVVIKARGGRKASTYVSGFEPFLTVETENMANELRKMCASATSVSPLLGKSAGMEVMVQGKQSKAALAYLTSNGVPKQWIEVVGR